MCEELIYLVIRGYKMVNDTIAAISTPFAQGGIGIIKISGSNAKVVAAKVFKSTTGKSVSSLTGYQALFGHVFDDDGVFDEAVLLNFNGPRSYTGEDVVEISVHSGLYILKRVLRAVLKSGARLAEGGEFTKRAFINGKMTLTEAESVMDLISAQNKQAANAALMVKQGAVFKSIVEITNQLVEISANISAWMDYPEEDIINISKSEIKNQILQIKKELMDLASTFDMGRIFKEGINVVIIGKPNVGKSTLMNLLSGSNRSIVADIPGTTRDVIEENILLDDLLLNLSDTAGLRETEDVVERQGVLLAKQKIQEADVVLAVFDSSRDFDSQDRDILKQIEDKLSIMVVNKIDLISDSGPQFDLDHEIKEFGADFGKNIIKVSGNDLNTRNVVSEKIKEVLNIKNIDSTTVVISNERQLCCINNALKNIENVINSIENDYTYDAILIDVEFVIESLLELTGERVSDRVVEGIFSKFCVGK